MTGVWNTMPIRRLNVSTGREKASSPSNVTVPETFAPYSSAVRLTAFKSVDFPQPEPPMMAVILFFGTERFRFFNTVFFP